MLRYARDYWDKLGQPNWTDLAKSGPTLWESTQEWRVGHLQKQPEFHMQVHLHADADAASRALTGPSHQSLILTVPKSATVSDVTTKALYP